MFTVPTTVATDLLANVSDTLSDPGFLIVLVTAAAIPLVFYVAKRLIALIPKGK